MKAIAQRGLLLSSVFFGLFFWLQAARTTLQNKNAPPLNRDARLLFADHCATCHGKDGRAKTFKAKFNHARNLTDPEWQTGVTDERLFNSITNGRGKMPAFGKKFSEAETSRLVAYVRQLKK